MPAIFTSFRRNQHGGVSIEAAFLSMIMVAITGGAIEAGHAFFQWNSAQQAARVGARIAATSTPVANHLQNWTGIGGGVNAGDPMPDYAIQCSGKTHNCTQGGFYAQAMNEIVFGSDNDGDCSATTRDRRGMCDILNDIQISNVIIDYKNSGQGRAGNPADPAPLITITLTDLQFDFVFLDLFTPQPLRTMPDVSVTLMGEDLRSGA